MGTDVFGFMEGIMKYIFDWKEYARVARAAAAEGCVLLRNEEKALPVKEGERGIRQSDAVFHHTKAYPELLNELFENINNDKIEAVGVSFTPTTEKGSYMPCFLVGESFASSLSTVLNTALYPPSAIPVQPDLKERPFETIIAFKPALSTSIAALEPAPPEPIINTSVEIVFISISITL